MLFTILETVLFILLIFFVQLFGANNEFNSTNNDCFKSHSVKLNYVNNTVKSYCNNSILTGNVSNELNQTCLDSNVTSLVKICFKKCCGNGYSVSARGVCVPNENQFHVNDIKYFKYKSNALSSDLSIEEVNSTNYNNFFIVYCQINDTEHEYEKIDRRVKNPFYILTNGSLLHKSNDDPPNFSLINIPYCLEYSTQHRKVIPYHCSPTSYKKKLLRTIQIIAVIISIVLLSLTILIYLILPDLKNIPGKCLLSEIATHFISSTSFFLYEYAKHKLLRTITGFLLLYGLMTNFFWTNVLCYDIWLVFRGSSPIHHRRTKNEANKKFKIYSIYAWGVPFIICFVAPFLQILEDLFSIERGFLVKVLSNSPAFILVTFNTGIFINTTYIIYRHMKEIKPIQNSKDSNFSSSERKWLYLYFKFFLIMGVIRIPQLVLSFFDDLELLRQILVKVINATEGIPIFIIFVCNERILKGVYARIFGKCESSNLSTNLNRISVLTQPSSTDNEFM